MVGMSLDVPLCQSSDFCGTDQPINTFYGNYLQLSCSENLCWQMVGLIIRVRSGKVLLWPQDALSVNREPFFKLVIFFFPLLRF